MSTEHRQSGAHAGTNMQEPTVTGHPGSTSRLSSRDLQVPMGLEVELDRIQEVRYSTCEDHHFMTLGKFHENTMKLSTADTNVTRQNGSRSTCFVRLRAKFNLAFQCSEDSTPESHVGPAALYPRRHCMHSPLPQLIALVGS